MWNWCKCARTHTHTHTHRFRHSFIALTTWAHRVCVIFISCKFIFISISARKKSKRLKVRIRIFARIFRLIEIHRILERTHESIDVIMTWSNYFNRIILNGDHFDSLNESNFTAKRFNDQEWHVGCVIESKGIVAYDLSTLSVSIARFVRTSLSINLLISFPSNSNSPWRINQKKMMNSSIHHRLNAVVRLWTKEKEKKNYRKIRKLRFFVKSIDAKWIMIAFCWWYFVGCLDIVTQTHTSIVVAEWNFNEIQI